MLARTIKTGLVLATALMLLPLVSSAQTVSVTAKAGKGKVILTLTIPSGYHIYAPTEKSGIPTSIKLNAPAGASYTPQWPATKSYKALEGWMSVYMGKITIPVAITGVKGKQTVKLSVRTQMCNDRTCLPPATADITMDVKL